MSNAKQLQLAYDNRALQTEHSYIGCMDSLHTSDISNAAPDTLVMVLRTVNLHWDARSPDVLKLHAFGAESVTKGI